MNSRKLELLRASGLVFDDAYDRIAKLQDRMDERNLSQQDRDNARRPDQGYSAFGQAANEDMNRRVQAIFVVTVDTSNLKKGNPELNEPYLGELCLALSNSVNLVFRTILGISSDFFFVLPNDEQLKEHDLSFNWFEDVKSQSLEKKIRKYNSAVRRSSSKTRLNAGIHILNILPGVTGPHFSDADRGGIIANVFQDHLGNLANGPATNPHLASDKNEFVITLIHEICHLLGLADRYQYLISYKLNDFAGCMEPLSMSLIPVAVNPKKDPEALTSTVILNNLMYGVDNYCLVLTRYQRRVILGYETIEPAWDQLAIFIPEGQKLETESGCELIKYSGLRNDSLFDFKSFTPIIGVDKRGIVYTYTNIDAGKNASLDKTGLRITIDSETLGDAVNDRLGIIVYPGKKSKPKKPKETSNELGKKFVNTLPCDSKKGTIEDVTNGN